MLHENKQSNQNGIRANFKYKLLSALQNNSQRGTTLVVGVALGALMIGATGLAIATSSQNKTNVTSDERSAQAVAVAEGGISQLLGQFSSPEMKPLLFLDYDPLELLIDEEDKGKNPKWTQSEPEWSENKVPPVNACSLDNSVISNIPKEKAENIPSFNADNPEDPFSSEGISLGNGVYRLLAYNYRGTNDEGIGTFLVQSNLTQREEDSARLMVSFPVERDPNGSGDGIVGSAVMAEQLRVGKNDVISSSIVCTDPANCVYTCSEGASSPTNDQLKDAVKAKDNGTLHSIFKQSNGSAIPTNISVGGHVIPPIPSIPVSSDNEVMVINLGKIGKDIELPRSSDIMSTIDVDGTTRNVYYYQITDIDKSTIEFTDPNAEYRIYVSGKIRQTGNDDIIMSSGIPNPGQIRIYGNSTSGNPKWDFGGNSCTMAFLHAPNAHVGISGGGNGCKNTTAHQQVVDNANLVLNPEEPYTTANLQLPNDINIYGGIWAKSYNTVAGNDSNAGKFYEQPGLMQVLDNMYTLDDFGVEPPITISPVTDFQRLSTNSN